MGNAMFRSFSNFVGTRTYHSSDDFTGLLGPAPPTDRAIAGLQRPSFRSLRSFRASAMSSMISCMISSSERPASSGEGLRPRSYPRTGRMPPSTGVRVMGTFGGNSEISAYTVKHISSPKSPALARHYGAIPLNKNGPARGRMKGAWRCPTFTWGDPTLSSAMNRFTVEFGMGSGGSSSLWSPGGKRLDDSQRSIKQKV